MKLIVTSLEELKDLVETSVETSLKVYFARKEKESKQPKNFSVKEAAVHLKVSDLTVRNYIKRGLIKADRIGSRIIINRQNLESTLKEVKSLKYKR